jgi:hypothetical protein
MPMQIAFWFVWFVAAFFAFYGEYTAGQPYPWPRGLRWFFFLIITGMLGWKVFGQALT